MNAKTCSTHHQTAKCIEDMREHKLYLPKITAEEWIKKKRNAKITPINDIERFEYNKLFRIIWAIRFQWERAQCQSFYLVTIIYCTFRFCCCWRFCFFYLKRCLVFVEQMKTDERSTHRIKKRKNRTRINQVSNLRHTHACLGYARVKYCPTPYSPEVTLLTCCL